MSASYKVGNINAVPEQKGVYAWYLKPQLSTYDIENLIKKINNNIEPADLLVQNFLEKNIFSPTKETPYKVNIHGKLKPKYAGELLYESPNMDSLTARIIKNPQLLFEIKKIFESVRHDFLSPIYIGMAQNLKTRLCSHVNLMKKLRESEASFQYDFFSEKEICHLDEKEIDHRFAHEVVVQRKLDINDLEVHILHIDFDSNVQVEIENILNRINYPLCGRN